VEVQLAQPAVEPRVPARALGSTTIEVRLRNGRSLMVAASFDARHLRALVAVVESCWGCPVCTRWIMRKGRASGSRQRRRIVV
jgi:hypothetical protein